MGKLSEFTRNRIVSLKSSGTSITMIRNILEEEGIKTSRPAISLFLSRYERSGSLADAKRSGRKPILSGRERDFIDDKMKNNDELTSSELKHLLSDKIGVNVSSSTVRRVRQNLGWRCEKSTYCQLIREPNKIKWLSFC